MASTAVKIVIALAIVVFLSLFVGYGSQYASDTSISACQAKLPPIPCAGYGPTGTSSPTCAAISDSAICQSTQGCYLASYDMSCQNVGQDYFSLTAVVLGILMIVVGLFLLDYQVISGGLLGAGAVSLIIAVVGYWSRINGLGRVILVLVVGLSFIGMAFKLFGEDR